MSNEKVKTEISPEELVRINEAFERYDRLKDFETRLARLINSTGIDSLLNTPDYILAAAAKNQMELVSSIIKAVTS